MNAIAAIIGAGAAALLIALLSGYDWQLLQLLNALALWGLFIGYPCWRFIAWLEQRKEQE